MNTATKLQKEINSLAKLSMIEGELFIQVKVEATNYNELEEISELILNSIVMPEGFNRNENLVSRKGLKIYISFIK
jgi:hypothetical protein